MNKGSGFITGPNVISVIVTLGFFATLFLILFKPTAIATNDQAWQIINIMVGSLGTMFTVVVHYQMGSTRTSQAKDQTIQVQAEALTQNGKPPPPMGG